MLRLRLLSSRFLGSVLSQIENDAKRTLYSSSALGIDNFVQARDRIKNQITNLDSFKSKMLEFVKDESSKNMIFTEDLKNMVHICEKPEDLELVRQMIERFCAQSESIRFGNFVFGPPVMRMLHKLNDTETALNLFKNEALGSFFDQLVSYQLLADMLYENKRYQDILDLFDLIKSRQIVGGRFPRHVVVITFGACYKLNTPESFQYATKLWEELKGTGHTTMRRGITFIAALALNQKSPAIALEIVSSVKQQNYLTIRAIKALAFLQLKRYDDVLSILRTVLEVDNPMANKQTFPVDVIETIKKDFETVESKELQADFKKVVGFLEKHGHVSKQALDDILTAEIADVPPPGQMGNDGSGQRGYNNRFNQGQRRNDNWQRKDFDRDNRDNRGRSNQRYPGLHELN